MTELTQMKCVACRSDSPKVTEEEISEFKLEIPDWNLLEVDGINVLRTNIVSITSNRRLLSRTE